MLTSTMPLAAFIPFLSAWIAAFGADDARPAVSRTIIHEQLVIHVPIRQRRHRLIEWTERKGPKCLPVSMIAGAAMAGPSSIDFVLRNRRRVRAELDSDCDGLDFYDGFYVEPENDEVCARRAEIRLRAGSSCRIERFRLLVPRVKR